MRASRQIRSTSAATALVEVDDICAIDPLPGAVKMPQAPALDDTIEIELTAEQMDALLSGR
ncbi:MAG TPA: hypothetical protein VJS12_01135 [Steroidobacteraceae bacterium]|nr:hypothetical protein [Steroidobacteraceae bacterium]